MDTFAVFCTQLSQYGVKILWKGSTTIVTDRQTDGRTDGTAEVLSYKNMNCPSNNDLCFYIYFYTLYSYHIKKYSNFIL